VNPQYLPEEFERLYCEHSRFIYRTAYRITGNSEDAEDAMQTLFVRLLRRELPPDFDRNPKAYLYRAAVNTALNIVRARKLRSPEPSRRRRQKSHLPPRSRRGKSSVAP
jgi:RNA polymerase sigma-70 factor (ECF subfamily)